MEKFWLYLEKAEKIIPTIDHLIYVTFPLIKDKRLLLKILLEEKEAMINCINSVLQYEYLHKRISLHKDSRKNFIIFKDKCAWRYNIGKEEINLISELFALVQVHNESDFEFYRGEKVIMLSENLKTKSVSIEKIKEFLSMIKTIFQKIKNRFLSKI